MVTIAGTPCTHNLDVHFNHFQEYLKLESVLFTLSRFSERFGKIKSDVSTWKAKCFESVTDCTATSQAVKLHNLDWFELAWMFTHQVHFFPVKGYIDLV